MTIRYLALSCAATLAFLAAPAAAQALAQERPAMTAQDLVTLPRLGSPTVSPDGRLAVYGVTRTDPGSYARTTEMYVLALSSGSAAQPVRLELPAGANSTAFGKDGWLYFLADGAAPQESAPVSQVWRTRITATGANAPEQVTRFTAAVAGFAVSPTGQALAVWRDLPRECSDLECSGRAEPQPAIGNARVYDAADGFVRHWDTWLNPEEVSRVFVYPLQAGRVAGTAVPLDGPAGEDTLTGNTPTKPFGGAEDIAWAPDGKAVYFVARRKDGDEPRSTNLDIWRSDLGGTAPVNLTDANDATDTLPVPSPNGRWLAYVAMARPGYEADRQVITLRDLRSGTVRALTQGSTAPSAPLPGHRTPVTSSPRHRMCWTRPPFASIRAMAGSRSWTSCRATKLTLAI
jgi:dipeptidyl aminopeptidase/acylaminoacyl peptidase